MTLHRHEWGEPGAPLVVCLHGVASHGRHFARLAERLAPPHHVVALDLRGHGDSDREPPWSLDRHLADVLESAPAAPATWLGHSFGGRLAFEAAAAAPERVSRLVLLDPVILLSPHAGLDWAENARTERSYASFEEAIDRRYEESALHDAPRKLLETELRPHLVEDEDGRWRYRYNQSAVVTAYGEMSRQPPPFEAVQVPTLLVLGEDSYLPYDHVLDAHVAALGAALVVERVPGGHSVLWDAFDETSAAIERFLT